MFIPRKEFSYREFVEIMENNGYAFLRNGKGEHKIYSNGSNQISVPYGKMISKVVTNRLIKENSLKL